MKHTHLIRSFLLGLALIAVCAAPARAVPSLQLGITGGVYDQGTETTVSTGDAFTLYALMTLAQGNTLGDFYYVSAAVVPNVQQTTPPPDLGFFTWNGVRYNVTSDMAFGTPPLDETLLQSGLINTSDNGDLAAHGIFPTYFSEFKFQFDPTKQTSIAYNTNPYDPDGATPNQTQYFANFNVDTSGLNPGYALHFDLYNEQLLSTLGLTDVDINRFAPFSHDAESCGATSPCDAPVPEPGTLMLWMSGLLLAAVGLRRRARDAALMRV